jgi:DNA-binding helix-hairpin-helix protein with protein kinase domain
MRVRLEKDAQTIVLAGPPLARGGEATIYELPQRPTLVAKVYHQPAARHAEKLAAMLAAPPADPMAGKGHVSIAWPTDRLLKGDAGQDCVGFVMPLVDRAVPVLEFFNPQARLRQCPGFHYGYLLRTARNLAAAVRAVHEKGYVIGDLNESNVLVNNQALVTLVDTDSFQVAASGRVHRCPVGKAEYTPPELQGANFADVDRGPEHDAFALAVLIFQLLMQGIHPFAGRYLGQGEPAGLGRRIAGGHWPYTPGQATAYEPNPHAPPLAVLPAPVQDLLTRCLVEGHTNPARRPNAAAWLQALQQAETLLTTCPANPQHHYHRGLAGCPWCGLALVQGRDPFPSPQPSPTSTVQGSLPPPLAPAPQTEPAPGGKQPPPSEPVEVFFDPVQQIWKTAPTVTVAPASLTTVPAGPRPPLLRLCLIFLGGLALVIGLIFLLIHAGKG